jgi:fumarylacetoacetase
MAALDDTHDPKRRSWLPSANAPGADFPLQNLPFCVFRRAGTGETPRGGVGIGDRILDMAAAASLFTGAAEEAAAATGERSLNRLMAMGKPAWLALRKALSQLLGAESESRRGAVEPHLLPIAQAEFLVPAEIGDFSDFYTSIYHATNVGKLLRPDNPLLPNYKYLPVAYHGRASSVVPSGVAVKRPKGQIRRGNEPPVMAPSRALDYETELGFYIGPGNPLGETIPIDEAADRIFGVSILNDWSARDIQAWEYQPLGPFLAKSFATTISPWIVTMAALEPFRSRAFARAPDDPAPLSYLSSARDQEDGGLNIAIDVLLRTRQMRERGEDAMRLGRCNLRHAYWTVAQMVTHHASNGCNLRPGDLLGSGTLSGPEPDELGCLIEITKRGTEPLKLANGEERRFLEDGDEIVMRGRCERTGFVGIGLGEARAVITPA